MTASVIDYLVFNVSWLLLFAFKLFSEFSSKPLISEVFFFFLWNFLNWTDFHRPLFFLTPNHCIKISIQFTILCRMTLYCVEVNNNVIFWMVWFCNFGWRRIKFGECVMKCILRGADKSLARPRRKQVIFWMVWFCNFGWRRIKFGECYEVHFTGCW